jgi:cyclase
MLLFYFESKNCILMKKFILPLVLIPLFAFAQRDYSKMQVAHDELTPGVLRLFVGNSVAVVAFSGNDGLMLIDAAYEQTVSQLNDTLSKLVGLPVRYLVNTHLHGDHTGGNIYFGRDADIIAHHSVKAWLASDRRQGDRVPGPVPDHAIPNITFEGSLNMEFNGQLVEFYHLPGGHTEGDLVLHLTGSNVLIVGDLLFAGYFPYVDIGHGGNPHKFIENLQWVTENFNDDAIVVGGHGPVFTMEQVRNYISNLEQTMAIVAAAKSRGMSAEQIKEAGLLKKWESYGSFFITEERWIDTVYPFAGN